MIEPEASKTQSVQPTAKDWQIEQFKPQVQVLLTRVAPFIQEPQPEAEQEAQVSSHIEIAPPTATNVPGFRVLHVNVEPIRAQLLQLGMRLAQS